MLVRKSAGTGQQQAEAVDRHDGLLPANLDIPSGLPPYLRDLYRTSLLGADGERRAFRTLDRLKQRRQRLEQRRGQPGRWSKDCATELARVQTDIVEVRNHIAQGNLRLVASIAKKFAGNGQLDFFELVSEGNDILLNAVDRFDVEYGTRFSTYATTAIRRHLAKVQQTHQRHTERFVTGSFPSLDSANDCALNEGGAITPAHFRKLTELVADLDERERLVVEGRFGLGHASRVRTFVELGRQLGISKERARQLHLRALDKLRDEADRQRIEPPA